MKTTRGLVIFAGAFLATASVWAQAIQNVLVYYGQDRVQTSSSVTTGASGTPFFFAANIEGDGSATDTSPITGASVTLPDTTLYNLSPPSVVGSAKWKYVSTNFADLTGLQAAYGNGTYTMNLTGGTGYGSTTVTLGNVGTSYMNNPLVGLASSGGSWGGGVYTFTVGQNITVSFNNISLGGGGDTDQYHYDAQVNGPGAGGSGPNGFVTAGTAASNYIIDTSAFVAGQTYTLEVGYDDLLSFNPDAYSGNPANVLAAGLYEIRSTVTLQAIPEPSTYAAILGAVAIAGAIFRRRRQGALSSFAPRRS